MTGRRKLELDPYHRFSRAEWAKYRDGEPMTLGAADIERLRALTDPISLAEAEEIYLPLTRLISFYVEAAQAVHRVSTRFLGAEDTRVPFIIGLNDFPDTEQHAPDDVREALALAPDVPVVRMDARSSDSGIRVLVTLVEHALARAEARQAPAYGAATPI